MWEGILVLRKGPSVLPNLIYFGSYPTPITVILGHLTQDDACTSLSPPSALHAVYVLSMVLVGLLRKDMVKEVHHPTFLLQCMDSIASYVVIHGVGESCISWLRRCICAL